MREIGRTFIGPVQKESVGRVSSHHFKLFAKGMSQPFVLTYPLRIQALQARDTMGAAENSYLVPTAKLFDAIVELANDTMPVLPAVIAEAALAQQEPTDDL